MRDLSFDAGEHGVGTTEITGTKQALVAACASQRLTRPAFRQAPYMERRGGTAPLPEHVHPTRVTDLRPASDSARCSPGGQPVEDCRGLPLADYDPSGQFGR